MHHNNVAPMVMRGQLHQQKVSLRFRLLVAGVMIAMTSLVVFVLYRTVTRVERDLDSPASSSSSTDVSSSSTDSSDSSLLARRGGSMRNRYRALEDVWHRSNNNNNRARRQGIASDRSKKKKKTTGVDDKNRVGDFMAPWQHALVRRLRRALVRNNEAYDRGRGGIIGRGEKSENEDGFDDDSDSGSSSSSSSNNEGSSGSGSDGLPTPKIRYLPSFLSNPAAGVKRLSKATNAAYISAIMKSEPVLFERGAVKCTKNDWTLDFIRKQAGDNVVAVETTKSNIFYANEGLHKEKMTVSAFLDEFQSKDRKRDLYLAEESIDKTPLLKADVVEPFFSEDFDLDRLQIWIGPGNQVAPCHHDQWDNVLCQLKGERTVIAFDPLQVSRLYPKRNDWRHFSQTNPLKPDFGKFPRLKDVEYLNITLREGEVLVLPATWWHVVIGGHDANVAVNFWYLPSRMTELLYDILLPRGNNYD